VPIAPNLWQALTRGVERVKQVVESGNFQIHVNDSIFETKLLDAVLVSPAIHNQITNDPTSTSFFIKDPSVNLKTVSELFELLSTDIANDVSVKEADISDQKSMIRLCQHLKNRDLEKYLLPAWSDGIENTSDVATHFYSLKAAELSLFSVECLLDVVSSDNLVISDEDSLLEIILELGEEYYSLLDYVRYEFLSEEGICKFVNCIQFNCVNETMWSSLKCRLKGICDSELKTRRHHYSCEVKSKEIDSCIIDSVASIFGDLCSKKFELLYRGSRDGFGGYDFHSRCDNKGATVTVVETTKGFIFGGYTPLSWDSSSGYRQDDSLKSFLFSLKNSRNTEPKRFSLKPDMKQYAICCNANCGPIFGGGHDFYLAPNSNSVTANYSNFGWAYEGCGYDARTFLAGEYNFTVKEVEVFLVK
jgi:hypothetical protein